jgi:hypothetical protein
MILFLPETDDYATLFVVSLLVPVVLGTGIGIATGAIHTRRALFISFLGSLSITGGAFLVIFSFITFGSGCLV